MLLPECTARVTKTQVISFSQDAICSSNTYAQQRRVSAVLAAYAELEHLPLLKGHLDSHLAAHLASKAHERTNAGRVDRLERILLQHPLQ